MRIFAPPSGMTEVILSIFLAEALLDHLRIERDKFGASY